MTVEKLTFLFCDDDPVIRYLLEVLLSKRGGHNVVPVEDPLKVVGQAQEALPDIILLDYVMPGITGMDVVKQLRQQPDTSAIPVVFLTGRTDVADVESLEALGIKGVIEKPFDTSTFVERVIELARR